MMNGKNPSANLNVQQNLQGWAYFVNDNVRVVPEDKCETEYNHNILFKVFTAIFNFYIPLITMIILNSKIYIVIHKRYQNPIMKYTSTINNDSRKTASPLNSSVTSNRDGASFRMKKKRQLSLSDSKKMSPLLNLNNSTLLLPDQNFNSCCQNNSFISASSNIARDGTNPVIQSMSPTLELSSEKRKARTKVRILFCLA